MWSKAKVKIDHRLAMHLRVGSFRMRNDAADGQLYFDDLPKSAVTTGANILEAHGARGTSTSRATWSAPGHPTGPPATPRTSSPCIARGTRSVVILHHKRACDLDAASFADEIARNRSYFRSLDPSITIETFAYPFGYGSFARKHQLKTAFSPAAASVPAVNSGTWTWCFRANDP